MGFKDLREWIAKLDSEGDLLRVKTEVDWNMELAEVSRRAIAERRQALLFERIKDHGHTLSTKFFTNGLATRSRIAMMLGLAKDAPRNEIFQMIRKRLKAPIKPVRVETGPVKENIVKGPDIDLFQFPVPKWHPKDGGRYIDTFSGTVTRDPDSGELNVGLYRGMIAAKDKIAKFLIPHQHWGQHYLKYKQRQEPMPVALVYGWDDALPFIGGASLSHPPGEYEIIGGIRKEPVELVRCETSDLEVPARAEIVIEGRVSPDPATYEDEGPFGEWTGYYGWRRKRPVIQVESITYRNDPILRGTVEGSKPGVISESGFMSFYSQTALIWQYLENAGVPGVLDIVSGPTIVVKIKKMYAGHAKQVAAALFGSTMTVEFVKAVVVVDDDIDIHNLRAIELAIRDRVDPKDDLIVFPGFGGSTLDPSAPWEFRDELKYGATPQNKLLVDATIDWIKHPVREEWGGRRYPPTCTETPPEIEKLVDQKWKEYGF